MKKNIFLITLLSIATSVYFIGCKKDTKTDEPTLDANPTINSPNSIGDIDNFLSRKATPAQTVTINNTISNNIVTVNESTITIPSNTFQDSVSATYPNNVVITIKEAFTYKDFICNNLITITSSGDWLNSAGMIYINASQITSTLTLKQVQPLKIKFYSPNTANNINNTQVFNLNKASNTWQLSQQSSSAVLFDSLSTRNVYSLFNVLQQGWINCDAFNTCPNLFPGQNYIFKTTNNFTTNNTKVCIMLTNGTCGYPYIKFLMWSRSVPSSLTDFYLPGNIPNNVNIKAIAISKINNQWYYEVKPVTIIQNTNMTFANLTAVDSVQLVNNLNAL